MSYRCIDCSYRSAKRYPDGKCPACGSFNIVSQKQKPSHEPAPKPKASKEKIFMLILFWSLFIYGLWDNYISVWLDAAPS